MRTHNINPYVVNTDYRCESLIQNFKGYRLFKKKETVVPPKTAEELKKEAASKWHDNALFELLRESQSGTTGNFRRALLQRDKYFKCSYFLDEKLLTCYTKSKPEDNFGHKVLCGYMPFYSDEVYQIPGNMMYVPLNDARVLWHEYRMMDKSTPESLAIYLTNRREKEAWRNSPAGRKERKDMGLTEI